ncbi:MAG: mechanosensitive ion channel [Candidatus Moranbacteria bacterium]|nr:mechanosensitive ion channel [Candidatus Moranbacteria bacterium]
MEKLKETMPFLNQSLWGNTYEKYFISLFIFIGLMILLKIFKSLVLIKIKKLSQKTQNDFDDFLVKVIEDIKTVFFIITALYVSFQFLTFNSAVDRVVFVIFLVTFIVQVILVIQEFIDYAIQKFFEKNGEINEIERKNREAVVKFAINLAKASLWIVGAVLVLSNLGINVTSLITGLGIGGIAIALAIQSILGDLFSSLSILSDKPFQVGDFISTGQESGTVKKIGIKTTRVTTLDGDELVIPNKNLTESRVHNFKKIKKRRGSFDFGITYETSRKKLEKIPQKIEEIINNIDKLEIERVTFKEFGDSSLVFNAVFYIDSPDYGLYMKKRQVINFKIMEYFEKEGIEFAYPTRTVFLRK